MKLVVHTDGGSLSNPGQAAIGYLIYTQDKSELIHSAGRAIGVASNNVAEYTALITALAEIANLRAQGTIKDLESIQVFADSELMIKQINGLYKVKHSDMRDLLMQVRMKENELGVPIVYTHILREKNAEADKLVKQALGR
ncbi:MAG: ribonuclease HI family protein [Patescibacteria group bacterium]|nr:ribonuclease HI family protein [Patescibacteria group bacterium]